jgi:hypothetical protein
VTLPLRAVIVRNGRERSLHDLNRGDVIAFREWRRTDDGGHYVFDVVTPMPASDEVAAADGWNCIERGHRWTGVPKCLVCGARYDPDGDEAAT